MINQDWIKRRWLDFRQGHSVYLIFIIQFMQFIIITYELNIRALGIFPSIFYWVGIFMITYLPAAILIGYFHLKKQIPTEARQMTKNNPYTYQTTPGKEQLYSLEGNKISYEMTLKNMEMRNADAVIFEDIFGRPFRKFSKEDFEKIAKLKEMTERLQKGESINDIVGESRVQRHP